MINEPSPFSRLKPAQKFLVKWHGHGVDGYDMQQEYRFHPTRRWRFDFAWPQLMLAVEIDGFGYGHLSQTAIDNQNEKANAAIELGWHVLRYGSRMLGSHDKATDAVAQVCRVIERLEKMDHRDPFNSAGGLSEGNQDETT